MTQLSKSKSILIVVPVYNHAGTLGSVLSDLLATGHPVLVVDDGSTDGIEAVLRAFPEVPALRHATNQGKGAAIASAMQYAAKEGFRAIMTFDADGQHLARDVEPLVTAHRANPDALIFGARDFGSDASGAVPRSSKFGRRLSNLCIWLESGVWLDDTQTGLRVYPCDLALLESVRGRRFAFEAEVIARMIWQGRKALTIPVSVFYPNRQDRISHFNAFYDNFLLSVSHNKIFFFRILMLLGLYRPLKLRSSEVRGMTVGRRIIDVCGVRIAYVLLIIPVLMTFFSRGYERRALMEFYRSLRPDWGYWRRTWAALHNYILFAASIVDRSQIHGATLVNPPNEHDGTLPITSVLPQGAVLVGAHYGDWALIANRVSTRLTGTMGLVLDASVTPNFFKAMEAKLQGRIRVLNPHQDKLSFALTVKEILDEGGNVAFLADRVAGDQASMTCSFLGKTSHWLKAPFALSARLRVPVVYVCATKRDVRPSGTYDIEYQQLWDGRDPISAEEILQRYVKALEDRVTEAPQHWFNFFPFWRQVNS